MTGSAPDADEPVEPTPVEPDRAQPRQAVSASPLTYRVVPRVAGALLGLVLLLLVVGVLRGSVVDGLDGVVHGYFAWLSGWFPFL